MIEFNEEGFNVEDILKGYDKPEYKEYKKGAFLELTDYIGAIVAFSEEIENGEAEIICNSFEKCKDYRGVKGRGWDLTIKYLGYTIRDEAKNLGTKSKQSKTFLIRKHFSRKLAKADLKHLTISSKDSLDNGAIAYTHSQDHDVYFVGFQVDESNILEAINVLTEKWLKIKEQVKELTAKARILESRKNRIKVKHNWTDHNRYVVYSQLVSNTQYDSQVSIVKDDIISNCKLKDKHSWYGYV